MEFDWVMVVGWVGLWVQSLYFAMGWVGFGLKKLDPRTTLVYLARRVGRHFEKKPAET